MTKKEKCKEWLIRTVVGGHLVKAGAFRELDGISVTIDPLSRLDHLISSARFSFRRDSAILDIERESCVRQNNSHNK